MPAVSPINLPLRANEPARLRDELVSIVGADGIDDDAATRALFSEDIWAPSRSTVEIVVAPTTLDALAKVVGAITASGAAIAPRGAGMSYTSGYVPHDARHDARTVSLDLSRMDRVLEVDARNMTVTVQPGCTWATLLATLKPQGLRTPFWGPMSGLASTVGGGISQLNAMLGAGHYGTSSESVVGLAVVLADGRVLRTGARARPDGPAFYRHYGPDLTGLFCGDTGALGIKGEITLRLIRMPEHEGYASFAFGSGRELIEAMAEIARAGVAAETCAFDPRLTKLRMQRASLGADLKTLGAVVGSEKSLLKGLMSAGKIALAGRDLSDDDEFPLYCIAEGRSAAAVDADVATMRAIAQRLGGKEIENSVAKIIRSQPFPPLNSVLGPQGQRWVPIHGIAPLDTAADLFEAVEAEFVASAAEFERVGVTTAYLFTTLSTNGLIVEPVFYWPDARSAIHERTIEPAHLAKLPALEANADATAVVVAARARILAIFERFGCAHFQVGRVYPYRASRDAAAWSLLEAIKREVDPDARVNPGVLGLAQ